MPYGNVFTKINREYYQLTGAEKKIADYILSQRQECQYMSISELAEVAEVAEATVSRFCRRLGYRGYSAFKLAVAGPARGSGRSTRCTGRYWRRTMWGRCAGRSVQRTWTPLRRPWP